MLKLWYSKHELRRKYLAVCEEKRPLQQSRHDGRHSNLGTLVVPRNHTSLEIENGQFLEFWIAGTRGKTALLNSVRKHAAQLQKTVENYQARLAEFKRLYPDRACPKEVDYASLLKMQSDDPFWNDALFTNYNEPWAVDSDTQLGMRQISYLDRAQEEFRRLGWEVHRLMK